MEEVEKTITGDGRIVRRVIGLATYLYGREASEWFRGGLRVVVNRSGMIRQVWVDGRLVATYRANDGWLLPAEPLPGAPAVVVTDDAARAASEGRNVPARHVVRVVGEARANQEVLVVDGSGRAVAVGRLVVSPDELTGLSRGFAVRVRRSLAPS